MKRALRHLVLLLLLSTLLATALTVHSAEEVTMVRIGLYYASNALTSANLESSSGYGSGYRFGYYDSAMNFVELGRTSSSVTQLTVLRASDYYRSGSSYSMTDNGGELIGCYHIAVATGLSSYEEASALAEYYSDGFVAWIEGDYQVRVGTYATKDDALTAQVNLGLGGEIKGTSSYAINTVQTGSSQLLFQYDGGAGSALAVYPDVTGGDVEDIRTWFKGYRYNGSFRYERIDGGDLSVTNVVDLETYVKGVVPYEMNNAWPLEALKAQAICARTYAMIHILDSNHTTFDLCNSTCCQVYNGVGTSTSSYQANALTDQAVEETAGEFLWYDGTLAETYYSSSHGGGSESIANIWSGGNLTVTPYLCGVIDPYESLVSDLNSYSSWTRTYTSSEIMTKLQAGGYGIGTSLEGIEAVYSATGNVTSLIFHFANGKTVTFGPTNMRSSTYLGFPAIRFNVNGNVVESTGETTTTTTTTTAITVNGGETMADVDDLYIINGSGKKTSLDTEDTIYVLTGTGDKEKLDFSITGSNSSDSVDTSANLSGTTYTSATTYVFSGSGWGHSVGLSQYGAYAMADRVGLDYADIVTFYFPGTYVSTTG